MPNTGDAADSSPDGGKVGYPARGFPAITGDESAGRRWSRPGRGALRRADFTAEEADGGERMKLGTVRGNGGPGPGGPVEVTISGIGTLGSPEEIR